MNYQITIKRVENNCMVFKSLIYNPNFVMKRSMTSLNK